MQITVEWKKRELKKGGERDRGGTNPFLRGFRLEKKLLKD